MRIDSIELRQFAPFQSGSRLVFPSQEIGSGLAEVHLLVGPNGAGKTRLLALLCAALGNDTELKNRRIASKSIDAAVVGKSQLDEFRGYWEAKLDHVQWTRPDTKAATSVDAKSMWQKILNEYHDQMPLVASWLAAGVASSLVGNRLSVRYFQPDALAFEAAQRPATSAKIHEIAKELTGRVMKIEFSLDSSDEPRTEPASTRHLLAVKIPPNTPRPFALAFQGLSRLSDAKIEALKPIAVGKDEENLTFSSLGESDNQTICQALANLCSRAAMDSPENTADSSSGRWHSVKRRLEAALSTIADTQVRLLLNQTQSVQLRVQLHGKVMSIDELPDGLRAILGWLGACIGKLMHSFPDETDPLDVPLILLLDEPEGHLHPKWQRQVLLAAQHLLPHAQIIAATHSPFLISSINEGWVHILDVDASTNAVTVATSHKCGLGDTYMDAVEDALGLTSYQRYDPATEAMLLEFDRLRDLVLSGDWSQEESLLQQADELWNRGSKSLQNRIGRDLFNVDAARKKISAKPSKSKPTAVRTATPKPRSRKHA